MKDHDDVTILTMYQHAYIVVMCSIIHMVLRTSDGYMFITYLHIYISHLRVHAANVKERLIITYSKDGNHELSA